MNNRTEQFHFFATPEEAKLIRDREKEIGILNESAYLRKMAIDEAIVEVVQLPEEQTMDDSNSSTEKFENKDNWPDVEELVNRRGDETTVYLLADGRYMDRINAGYIYDGKDTWTDESGVEWNKAVK